MSTEKKHWSKKKRFYASIFILIFFLLLTYHQYKPLPDGVSYEGEEHQAEAVSFYRDLTYSKDDETEVDQEIFDRVAEVIEEAEEFVIIDMFLFDGRVNEEKGYPDLTENLTDQLVEKKRQYPDMPIVFITDPVNTGYYSYENEWLDSMEEEGIEVVFTNLDPLRDPTPLFSTAWRMGLQWFGQRGQGWLPNAFVEDGPNMTARSYLMMGNVKANHRKAVITEKSGMVLSANAHRESGFHSNVAYEVSGPVIQDMINAEQAVLNFSDSSIQLPSYSSSDNHQSNITVQYTTEGKTWEKSLEAIAQTKPGDEIWMAMFYLSERDIITELIDAAEREVEVFLILDPNETAFGNNKSGLPNRPVVNELLEGDAEGINVRWYEVREEQFHPKMLMIKSGNEGQIISGSTNFTKRNLADYNLENNIIIKAPMDAEVMKDTDVYLRDLWTNENGFYTVESDKYQDTLSFWQRGVYYIQKILGLTTY
ncbi:phospholipase D-like domain-containing protein [Jeotgalibacillus proteolyticus]|uniref:phospholipase D n=1 Tax=Jeotgalibacillus proteolyticus TaxID=2082395 RepID=A0A2S5GFZ5_9BACL|nr:phospholipase D-like domain-containing protein [Jeotgalibacillus proteolyticus]PPA71952.1 phospholipase [Jeotgalibacillus proteolyticus]